MKKLFLSLALFVSFTAQASVSLPYSFSPGQTIASSQVNADLTALMNELNTHESQKNGHFTGLSDILAVDNSCHGYSINFNEKPALGFRAENLSADPTPGNAGRIFYNTTTNLLKVDTGSALIPIGGINVPNLSTVLGGGNSAGTYNLDMNENQLLNTRVENLASNPTAGNAGRLLFNTTAGSLEVDTGSAIQAIGGAQGLSSVLGISNSAGSFNLNMSENQLLSMRVENVSSLPVAGNAGRLLFNTTNSTFYGDNGSSFGQIGGFLTALTGDVSASGSGSVPATINTVGGSTAANVHTAEQTVNGSQTANKFLASPNGSTGVPSFRGILAADVPTLNQNTTGTAAGLSTTLAIGSGGTGQTTASAAFNGLSPLTTLGDVLYGGASGTGTRLGGNTTTAKQFLTQTGTGSVSAAPAWGALVSGDIPAINLAGTGNGGVTGSLPPASLAQSGAISNQALVWSGSAWGPGTVGGGALSITGSTGTPQSITAAGGIAFTGGQSRALWFIQGSGGAVTVTASPQVAAATTIGQELVLEGTSDTNTVTLNDGTGLSLNGSATLYNHSSLYLVWDGTVWAETGRRQ